jgi:hypothetical protein
MVKLQRKVLQIVKSPVPILYHLQLSVFALSLLSVMWNVMALNLV